MAGPAENGSGLNASLYQRLGGVAGIAAIVDDAIDRHAVNPVLAPRFRGKDLPQLKQMLALILSAASGLPSPGSADSGHATPAPASISEPELVAALNDMAAAMCDCGTGGAEIHEMVGALFLCKSGLVPA